MKESSCKYTKVSNDDIESKYTSVGVDVEGVDNSYLLEDEKVRHEVTVSKTKGTCKKRCCLKRCLKICLYVILTFIGLATVAGIITYVKVAGVVQKWTIEHPYKGDLPVTDVPYEQLRILLDEGKLFTDRILADQQPSDFVLSATDINGFAASSDYLRGNMYVDINPNEVTAIESLPMEFLPGGRGRFLVGKTTMLWDAEESTLHAKMVPLDDGDEIADHPYFDVRLLVGFEEGQGLSSLTLLSGQFLDWSVSQDFIDERTNLLEVMKHSCGGHHRHGHHGDHGHHHHDKRDDDHHHHHGNDHHRHDHHHHHDVKADIIKVLSGIKSLELEEGQLVIRANSPEERKAPVHRMLTEENASYGKFNMLSTAFKVLQNTVRI